MTWRESAACLSLDYELFFPIGNTSPALLQTEEAKAACGRCEVVESCLSWAMESGQDSVPSRQSGGRRALVTGVVNVVGRAAVPGTIAVGTVVAVVVSIPPAWSAARRRAEPKPPGLCVTAQAPHACMKPTRPRNARSA